MKQSKRISIELPADDSGMIGRECPRCNGRFKIDADEFSDGGYLNLRCPYCAFIDDADRFLTGEQRNYIHAIQQDELLTLAEDMMGDILDDVFSGSSFETSGTDDLDFGNVYVSAPEFETDTDRVTCDDCAFTFELAADRDGNCPVCR